MIVLSITKWLDLFDNSKPTITYDNFMIECKVKSSYTYPLQKLVNDGKVTIEQTKILYEKIVIDKEKYLTNFFYNNLHIKDDYFENRTMENKEMIINNLRYPKEKNIVRNLYYEELLLKTKTIHKNVRPFLEIIIDLYKNHIIDYKLLTPSVLNYMENGSYTSMLSGLYFRASIMNPFLVYSLSCMRLDNPKRVLTPTLGWSSYLLGFMNNPNLQQYVGIDVIDKVCKTSYELCKKIRPDVDVNIYNKPSEDLYDDNDFMKQYNNYFDVVFFSPPYYQLELYDGENQSTNRYSTYKEWLNKYWLKTIQLSNKCLKENGKLCYIISGYKSGGKYLNLDEDMNTIVQHNGFIYKSQEPIGTSNVGFTRHRKHNETIYLFEKRV